MGKGNNMEFQKLTVHNYGATAEEDRRITLAPANINLAAATTEDSIVNGRSVRVVTILFVDGGSVDITVNHADLSLLEEAIGTFCLSVN